MISSINDPAPGQDLEVKGSDLHVQPMQESDSKIPEHVLESSLQLVLKDRGWTVRDLLQKPAAERRTVSKMVLDLARRVLRILPGEAEAAQK